ncbi:hypothetical protein F2Q70_00039812, partial [Brassica cretica]
LELSLCHVEPVLIVLRAMMIFVKTSLLIIELNELFTMVKLVSCGVCHSDLHVMKGEIPFSSPCVNGHEITSEVVEHGPLTDHKIIQRFPIGSRVVGAFIMPCGTCSYCAKVRAMMIFVKTSLLIIELNELFTMVKLVCFCVMMIHRCICTVWEGWLTYGAMAHAAEIRPGDSIAVIGIGGVGSSCLQIARDFGASDIIAMDVQDDKLEKAKTLGATSWLEPRLSLKEPIAIKKFYCLSSPKTEMVFPQLPSRDQETASLVIMLQQLQRRQHKEISYSSSGNG